MTGVILLPLVLAAGSAIDYSNVYRHKNLFHQALDSAVMAIAKGHQDGADTNTAITEGISIFHANCLSPSCEKNIEPVFTIDPGVSVSGTYSGKVDTTLLRIANIDSVQASVSSQVSISSSFQEFHFAVDRSASFGIPANDKAINDLIALTGCAFSCHEAQGWEPIINGKRVVTYDLAKQNGIPLREDILFDALSNAWDTILERIKGTRADQIKVGLYVFSDTLEVLSKPTALSTDLKKKLEHSTTRSWGTQHNTVLPELAKIIGKSGAGTSNRDRKKTLVLITDGATSISKPKDWWIRESYTPFDSAKCDAFKKNGVRVVVINIEYPKLDGQGDYDRTVGTYYDEITSGLKNCATTGYYYTANDQPEIQASLKKMGKDIRESSLYLSK